MCRYIWGDKPMDRPAEVIYANEPDAADRATTARAVALPSLIELNREMCAKFQRGEISFEAFDWHLRTICGV